MPRSIFRSLLIAYAVLVGLCLLGAAVLVALLKPGEIGGFAAFPLFLPAFPWFALIDPQFVSNAWRFAACLLGCYGMNAGCLWAASVVGEWYEDRRRHQP